MTTNRTVQKNNYHIWIWIVSIAIPVAVAILFTVRIPGVERMGFLPPIYASVNALTAVVLIIALFQIKKGNRKAHERFMKLAIGLSVLFLLMYVAYHMTSDSTKFGDTNGDGLLSSIESSALGSIKYTYYFLLFSHILLSVTVIPFVLVTYVRAINGDFKIHKKIARVTFPLWLYVAVTGVIVFLMISPYYPL
jgi:putative membrane protein|tara:strand:+ start:590 stop:1168 length:579 start_codon:yes stop_codon:yes gene_type:complete